MITLENEAQPRSIQTQESIFIEEKAFRSRMVLVFGNITDTIASDTVRRLLTLDAESNAPLQ
jgi:ATP-dependent Clp protease protease subunit